MYVYVFTRKKVKKHMRGGGTDLDGEFPSDIGEAHWQHGLALAEGARAASEVHVLEFSVLEKIKR